METTNNTNAKVMGALTIGGGLAALWYLFFKPTKKSSGLTGLPVLNDRVEDYPRMWQEARKFHEWASHKLGPDHKEQEADLIDYLKNYRDKLIERVGWVYTGNYGSEAYDLLRRQYIDIHKTKKGKNIVNALRALAIQAFYYYCYFEHSDLNAAKVRSIVTKTLSKEEMEQMNIDIIEKEILVHENDGDDSLTIADLVPQVPAKGKKLGKVDIIDQVAAKLYNENVTSAKYSKAKAMAAVEHTALPVYLKKVIAKHSPQIKAALKKIEQSKLNGAHKMTKKEAKQVALKMGIDFASDYHVLSSSQANELADLATKVGYRKPKNANGSTSRYFFNHLKKVA